jgi:hypothetical protein
MVRWSNPYVVEARTWRWSPTISGVEVKERVELYFYTSSGTSWSAVGWTSLYYLPIICLNSCENFCPMFLDRILLRASPLISGSSEVPQCISGCFVFMVAHLAVVVLLDAYSAFLISYLTFRWPVLPFSSFSEFLNDSTYHLGAHAASSYLKTSNTVSMHTIRRFGEVNLTFR